MIPIKIFVNFPNNLLPYHFLLIKHHLNNPVTVILCFLFHLVSIYLSKIDWYASFYKTHTSHRYYFVLSFKWLQCSTAYISTFVALWFTTTQDFLQVNKSKSIIGKWQQISLFIFITEQAFQSVFMFELCHTWT